MSETKKFNKSAYDKQYNKEHYKQIAIRINPEDWKMIDDYCCETGCSKADLIVKACAAWIDTH